MQKNIRFLWELVIVYGPADHSRSLSFLREIHDRVSRSSHPIVIKGDFNLLR